MSIANEIMGQIANELIEFECPNCNQNVIMSLNEVGDVITCPHCLSTISVQDAGFTQGLDEVSQSLNEIDKAFDNLQKTMNG